MTNASSPDKATNTAPQAEAMVAGPMPKTTQVDVVAQPAPVFQPEPEAPAPTRTAQTTNEGILGESTEALGADRDSLVQTTDTGKPRYTSRSTDIQETQALPDNSLAGLKRNKEITDARAFVRGQGIADHLYSDEAVVAEHKRFLAWAPKNYGKAFQVKLAQPITYFNTPKGGTPEAVKMAEYATREGAPKPYYKDQENADTSTPANPKLPG